MHFFFGAVVTITSIVQEFSESHSVVFILSLCRVFLLLIAVPIYKNQSIQGYGNIHSFSDEVLFCFKNYWKNTFNYKSRASVREYALALIPIVLVERLLSLLFVRSAPFLVLIFRCGITLPTLSLMVRRLHDTNSNGWALFWALVPLYGPFHVTSLLFRLGDEGENEFGSTPFIELQQQKAEKEKLRRDEATRVAAEQEQRKRELDEKQAFEKRRQLWDIIVNQYGGSSVLRDYVLYNMMPTDLLYDPSAIVERTVYISNASRIAKLNEILGKSPFFAQDKRMEPKGAYDSPYLRAMADAFFPKKGPAHTPGQFFKIYSELGKSMQSVYGQISPFFGEKGFWGYFAEYGAGYSGLTQHRIAAFASNYGYDKVVSLALSQRDKMTSAIKEIIETYEKEVRDSRLGLEGEEAVRKALALHDDAFIVFDNLQMSFEGTSGGNEGIEVDFLVLAPNGLFAIEVKNIASLGHQRLIVEADGQWYKESNGKKTIIEKNPHEQNDRHVAFLERFVNQVLGRNMMNYAHVDNIIVIANNVAEFVCDPAANQMVTRVGSLYNQLMRNKMQQFTFDELMKLKEAFENASLPPKSYPLADKSAELDDIYRKFKELRKACLSTEEAILALHLDEAAVTKFHPFRS